MKGGYIIWLDILSLVSLPEDNAISAGKGGWRCLTVSHLRSTGSMLMIEWLIDWDPASNVRKHHDGRRVIVVLTTARKLDVVILLCIFLAVL